MSSTSVSHLSSEGVPTPSQTSMDPWVALSITETGDAGGSVSVRLSPRELGGPGTPAELCNSYQPVSPDASHKLAPEQPHTQGTPPSDAPHSDQQQPPPGVDTTGMAAMQPALDLPNGTGDGAGQQVPAQGAEAAAASQAGSPSSLGASDQPSQAEPDSGAAQVPEALPQDGSATAPTVERAVYTRWVELLHRADPALPHGGAVLDATAAGAGGDQPGLRGTAGWPWGSVPSFRHSTIECAVVACRAFLIKFKSQCLKPPKDWDPDTLK